MKIIIFAGGVGTRLWPLSRKNTPKQFGKIIGDKSTLEQTISRFLPEFKPEDIFIATGERYKDTVMGQLSILPKENFIFEPYLRDVGPAIGLSSFILEKRFANEPIAILWSDHLVKNEKAFRDVLHLAEKQINAKEAEFVFIGQKPRFANQNLGWIELGEKIEKNTKDNIYNFKRICYRPQLEEAQEFFKNKNYVWNLGYFVTTPKYLTSLYQKYTPDMYEKLLKIQRAYGTQKYPEVVNKVYKELEKISFDDSILIKMEKTGLQIITTDLGWNDVGAWDALKEALADSKEENITNGDVLLENTTDTLIFNYSKKICIGIDLEEMIIIETDDVLLVCPKTSVPQIKKFVEKLSGTSYEHLI
jgi:mannose-1-phosphate guanylyltransferase